MTTDYMASPVNLLMPGDRPNNDSLDTEINCRDRGVVRTLLWCHWSDADRIVKALMAYDQQEKRGTDV